LHQNASAVALLERMYAKVDELMGKRYRPTAELVSDPRTYASGKAIRGIPAQRGM
jgi:hypothetical protein